MSIRSVNALITGAAPSSATTAVVGSSKDGFDAWQFMTATLQSAGNTGGTLNVYVQRFDPGLDLWVDWIAFPQIADGAASAIYMASAYAAPQDIYTIGSGTTPLLGADSFSGGPAGDQLRVIATSGAGTSVGATVKVSFSGLA